MKLFNWILVFIFLSIVAISCGDDEPDTCSDGILNGTETGIDCGGDCADCPTTTVAEDKQNIKKAFDAALLCITDIKNGKTADVLLREFMGLSEGEVFNEDWLDDLGDDLGDAFDADAIDDDERLDIGYHAGTYSYNKENNSWAKASNVTDKIIFTFPSAPAVTTNNVVLTLDQYQDKQVTISGDTYYVPTGVHGLITVDGEKIFEVTAKDIVYAENAEFEIPVEATVEIFMAPATLEVTVRRSSTVDFTAEVSFLDEDKCNISVVADVKLKDDDFENLQNDGFEKIDVTIAVGAMSLRSIGGLAELIALDDPTDTQFNLYSNLEVLYNAMKIADLEIDSDAEIVYIYYKDMTFEDSRVYYDDFLTELEELVTEFTGAW